MTTEGENELIVENLNLAYEVSWKYYRKFKGFVELDELTSLCFLALTKSARTFKKTLGFNFSTYAYTCMKNEILNYLTKNKKYFTDISIFEPINDDIQLQDTLLLEGNSDLNSYIDLNLVLQEINKLPKRCKQIMIYRLQGFTMIEIGKKLKLSQPQVSRYCARATNIIKYKLGI